MTLVHVINRIALSTTKRRILSSRSVCKRSYVGTPSLLQRAVSIGILREDYDKWERRTPLCPHHVEDLIQTFKHNGAVKLSDVYVQPASHRIFPDAQYEAVGAKISDDLSKADILLGVKRVSEADLLPGKKYMFFSHVIKGQPENMDLLQAILDKQISLFDYEAIAEDVKDPASAKTKKRRLVAFGKYAGIAGMLDIHQALGRRLLASGYSTPFLNCSPAYVYYDLEEAKRGVKEMGKRIELDGLPVGLEPLVFAFTGKGNVTKGALEIFQLLPHKMISLEEAKGLNDLPGPHKCVYGLMVEQKDMVKKLDDATEDSFDLKHYRANPTDYVSTFCEKIAPYTNVLVNGIYWDERYPRVLAKDEITELYKSGNKSLFAVADITCDVNGSIEFLVKTTTIDKPFFLWNPLTNEATDEITGDGVAVMGVDILPSELSVESSRHFGDALLPLMKQLIEHGSSDDESVLENLPPELANACIAHKGSLTPNFEYLKALMERPRKSIAPVPRTNNVLIRIEGHLFDSGLINQVLDVIEGQDCHFDIEECAVQRTVDGVREKSTLMIRVVSDEYRRLDQVLEKVSLLVELIDTAEASMQHYDNRVESKQPSSDQSRVRVLSDREQNVLVLGAGRVASSLAEYLGRSKKTKITVASQCEDEAMSVANNAIRGQAVACDLSQPSDHLKRLIEEADVVVSLLPAQMHPLVANECILSKTDLVTASYESDKMRSLRAQCEEAGITILNEVGLDPGMDHMSAMKIIDDVHARGGEITHFSSVCGGLPAPEAANNPLLYKFSWSPMGVMTASQNDAVYRRDGEIVQVDGANLLANAEPFDAWQSLHLECLPNRDSLVYGDKYGIQSASSIFRGTIRYGSFSSLLNVFKKMGLLDNREPRAGAWRDVLTILQEENSFTDLQSFILSCSDGNKELALRAYNCLDWLGMKEGSLVSDSSSIVGSFCNVLEQQLQYKEGERDMVLMHHDIRAIFGDGSSENHVCSLQLFGDQSMTAMCKTVGYTAAVGAKLILDGKLANKGLILPTSKEVYLPSLNLLEEEGLVFEEAVYSETEDQVAWRV